MDTACMEIHKALVNVIYVTLTTSVYDAGGQWAEEVTTKQGPLHRKCKCSASSQCGIGTGIFLFRYSGGP